ncbi:class I SAM-dependent methyltransferase [Gorillibacterium sp. sgz500922]|uniref:class I SAM-dependent methyltransferase n=1 Tax=Gorillibacterium sp. sgz500922 TaxID=3446694 RepID=UPI003F67A3EF
MTRNPLKNNVDRFTGFSGLYNDNRPAAPAEVVRMVTRYLGGRPGLVADVGCGTGLSSFVWLGQADRIVGFEPNGDMRKQAEDRLLREGDPASLRFLPGYSHELALADGSADAVTCSQSFHWMDPEPTLREFARVLRPGGVFAAYDCDWPPAFHADIESGYLKLQEETERLLGELPEQDGLAKKWDKERHLERIRRSGLFRYAREVVFHHWEPCTAERYVNLALSQGGLQTVLREAPGKLDRAIAEFRRIAETAFAGESAEVLFSYRMRLGVK